MTNDEGLKPEGAPERSSKAGGGVALSGGDKKRATDDAQGKKLIQVREVGGITYIWLVDPSEQN